MCHNHKVTCGCLIFLRKIKKKKEFKKQLQKNYKILQNDKWHVRRQC